MHPVPLEPFRGVDRREHQVVLVEVRRPRQVGARHRRVDHQLGDEAVKRRGLARRGDQLIEVLEAERAVGIATSDQRSEGPAEPLGANARARLARGLTQGGDHLVGGWAGVGRQHAARLAPSGEPISVGGDEHVQRPSRGRRTYAVRELEDSEPRDLIAPVVGQAEQRDQILDVRRLQISQPPVLDERDLAACQLQLEHRAVVGGPHQHGLAA